MDSLEESLFPNARIKYALALVGKGLRPAADGDKIEGAYRFFSSSKKVLYSNQCDYNGRYLLIGDGGVFNVNLFEGEFSASDHVLIYKNTPLYEMEYLYYWMEGHSDLITQEAFAGVGITNLNRNIFHSMSIPLPPLPEQVRIADYLDHETGKIDALVSELTEFSKTLKARTKSLIAECVTKGLPGSRDNRAMRDSEVEWIGEVPTEWEVVSTKRVAQIFNGGTPDANNTDYWDGGIAWVTPADMDSKFISKGKRSVTEAGLKNSSASVLPVGSLVLSKRAPIGSLAIVAEELATNQGCFGLETMDNIINIYLYYYFLSHKEYLESLGRGTTFMEISTSAFRDVKLPLPPLSEQRDIADYLDSEVAKSDALIAEVAGLVAGLQVYRKALISEVVTGKRRV